ncbi:MAG: hypothetical protein QOD74_411 [Variibacter sp.]|jgi:diguanylate cyclase (GGDEF)-like protein|nr:hypothetical protein [Variibacter sp.]
MRFWRRPHRAREDVPADVYISLVDSLFRDPRSLLMGSLAVVLAILLTAVKTGEPILFLCAAGAAAISGLRTMEMRAYAFSRPRIKTVQEAARWEFRYAVGTSAHIALLGAWCVIGFHFSDDPFVEVVSLSSTIANLIGVAGRNFGSRRLVAVQIVCAAPLITAALFTNKDVYHFVYGVLLLAFFISVKFISDRQRKTLLDAVIAKRDVQLLADRFDTALNNMPHGLCMVDAERQVVVANRRLTELLKLPAASASRGTPLRDVLRECTRVGTMLASNANRFAAALDAHMSGRNDGNLTAELQDGRTLSLTFQPMRNGGSVVLIEDVTDRKSAEAKINHLARFDALTGLPNRSFFRQQMDAILRAMRRKSFCATLFIDLDQFKQVNDTLGHTAGDELLRVVAARLQGVLRDSDLVSRFGGDEFVVLQTNLRQPQEAAALAKRIVDVLAEPYTIETHDVVIGASIGIAVAPNDGMTSDVLLKNADMALYRAKGDGRAGWRFFEPEMDVQAQARRSLELDLRNALANDDFEIYYQPIVNLKTRRITCCEALLRWPHPERGMISPAEFIPVAEEMGLIVQLGTQVLRKATLECMTWPADTRVAVNLSAIQFRRSNVVATVSEALEASGLPPDRLELEITESVLLQDTDASRAALQQLRDIGVRISLDDFGTGYSSLSYLHSFPLNKVKIDRSFLQGIDVEGRSLTLLRGVSKLSAELGLTVVIEGIETKLQLGLIARDDNIDEAQGFLFSRPVPAREVRKQLAAIRPAERVA